jgi:hypothetical protein
MQKQVPQFHEISWVPASCRIRLELQRSALVQRRNDVIGDKKISRVSHYALGQSLMNTMKMMPPKKGSLWMEYAKSTPQMDLIPEIRTRCLLVK